MLKREYLVIRRSGRWWVTQDGARSGPYASEKVAVDSAIESAKLDLRTGQAARVSLDDPDDGVPVVYDTEAA